MALVDLGEDLAWPLALDGTGDLAVVSGEDNVLSALPVRAVTALGEVVTHPDDGLNFEEFQNGLAMPEEWAVLEARLLEQYRRDDRLDSVAVDVAADEDVPTQTVAHLSATLLTGRTLSTSIPYGSS